jgi:hemerythrin-like metal-binding protein
MALLSDHFLLECKELDKDHERLAELVSDITDMLDSGSTENCKTMVLEFINTTKKHFAREEHFLTKIGYPDVEKHSRHHRQLYEKMDHILEFAELAETNEMARESLKKELVYLLMDDVITTDLEFKAFISDH